MRYRSLKNCKGSAAVFMLTIIPIFFLLGFTFALSGFYIQLKSRVRKTCIEDSIQIQRNIILSEKELFALNALSTTLRVQLIAEHAELALQIYAENPIGIAKANYQINSIRLQQQNLDRLQKGMIRAAEVQARLATESMLGRIRSHFVEMGLFWKFYITITESVQLWQSPEIAVRPDIDETAPNYELKQDYKSKQQLVLFWQHYFRTNNQAQKLLESDARTEMTCGAGPSKKGEKWSVEIKGDKF